MIMKLGLISALPNRLKCLPSFVENVAIKKCTLKDHNKCGGCGKEVTDNTTIQILLPKIGKNYIEN